MKHQADKNRSAREFVVGDSVIKASALHSIFGAYKSLPQIGIKFYGPYAVLELIG
jgi:hypothetical protein